MNQEFAKAKAHHAPLRYLTQYLRTKFTLVSTLNITIMEIIQITLQHDQEVTELLIYYLIKCNKIINLL